MRARLSCVLLLVVAAALADGASQWIDPNASGIFPASASYENRYGELGVLHIDGEVQLRGHPFFTALGTNGRACVSCHQPRYAMSVSAAGLRERWRITDGKDPVFAAIDGSNCPHLPQKDENSHSLLLQRGLFRVALPWPPRDAHGRAIEPEFTIEVVRDPTGCNTHREYGIHSPAARISVYRRPRPVANLKYVIATRDRRLFAKDGTPLSIDPDTGLRSAMNLMSDARHATLKLQAADAALTHLQMRVPPTSSQLSQIIDFESQLYAAQSSDSIGGPLAQGTEALGPENISRENPGIFGDALATPVFGSFAAWRNNGSDSQSVFRASVARGYDIFFTRPLWIRDVMNFNNQMGNPAKRTCASCHNMRMTGMDISSGWMDIGTTDAPWANDSPELPLFKITCDKERPPHPYLGRIIYTQDPGRALVSGRCDDVGAIVIQQMRGLAARPPYFSNGSAQNLREVVDFYDRRFNIRFNEQEKQDLVNFLSVL